MKYLCVIVLYKCNLYESKSYNTFIKHNLKKGNVGLYIYDNSPIPAHSKDESVGLGKAKAELRQESAS